MGKDAGFALNTLQLSQSQPGIITREFCIHVKLKVEA